MPRKNLSEYKRKYDVARHHAWAGSVLIGILLAVRVFLEISEFTIDDRIILAIGIILVIYTVISIIFTYKYRSGLTAEQKVVEVQVTSDDVEKERIKAEVEKERLKVEKKKAKAEAKRKKKEKKS
jgi:hypothetical protein